MKTILIATLPLLGGCIIHGDAAIPIVCSTRLPGTPYSVYLHGPNNGDFFYVIETHDGDCGQRHLGAVVITSSVTPKLDDLGNGVFRVTWGGQPNAPYATIDTMRRLFVDDSNESNQDNEPFETPRYLRPEYLKLRTGQ